MHIPKEMLLVEKVLNLIGGKYSLQICIDSDKREVKWTSSDLVGALEKGLGTDYRKKI